MGSQALIDCMTAASLPSTLVKCLYLFFDLPEMQFPDKEEAGCEFSAHERRVLLQKVFVQVSICAQVKQRCVIVKGQPVWFCWLKRRHFSSYLVSLSSISFHCYTYT